MGSHRCSWGRVTAYIVRVGQSGEKSRVAWIEKRKSDPSPCGRVRSSTVCKAIWEAMGVAGVGSVPTVSG